MKTIWTGAIGFGLVNIPVKLYSASHDSRLDLDMLDKHDFSNIKFQRINEKTGKVVNYEDIVKGYKYEDKYIVLEDEDFAQANAKKTKTIEILQFVQESEIDSIYYEMPYYLEPEKSGVRAYALLRDALKESKKVGVGNYVLRNKEALAVIKPMGDVLLLNKIRFQQEITDPSKLELPAKQAKKESEMKMALSLIDQLTQPFAIAQYKDTYTDDLMRVIEAKAQGKQGKVVEMNVEATPAQDLMAQLKASLERRKAS